MWPKASTSLVAGIVNSQTVVYGKFGISTALRLVHMWAQFSVETGEGTEMTESLNYTPTGLLKTFPSHFSSAQANEFGKTAAHQADQKSIGDLAYGSRMGNRPGTDDGYNFRGRGLIQTTGREGYEDLAKLTGLDLVNQPAVAIAGASALLCGVAEFVNYPHMLKYCDEDNVLAVSSLINVGHVVTDPSEVNGFEDRKAALAAWKQHLGL